MKPFYRLLAPLLGALALLPLGTTPARVHPHIFAEARLDVVASSSGEVTALRHLWRFDDLFSSTVLLEFDANRDLKLDAEELEMVGSVVHESLAEFNYFQFLSQDGKDIAIAPPDRLMAQLEDNQLIILFETRPEQPLQLSGKVEFGVYDPTFYTALDFYEDEQLAVENLPDGCRRAVVRPDPDEAIAANQASLTEDFFEDPSGNDLSKIFATRLELTCTTG